MDIFSPISREATLTEILDNREERVYRQRRLLEKYAIPIVSFTVNMPGAVKDNAAARFVFSIGVRALDTLIDANMWHSPERIITQGLAGPELILSVATDAVSLKRHTVNLEEEIPLARLFDFDVIDRHGKPISRTEIGMSPRRCLLCQIPAKECARSRNHGWKEVFAKVQSLVTLCPEYENFHQG